MPGKDSFKSLTTLETGGKTYHYFSLPKALSHLSSDAPNCLARLPFSLKLLLENLLRHEDGKRVTTNDIKAVVDWLDKSHSQHEIAYHPSRVLMQDFTGVPGVIDLAALREAAKQLGGDLNKINPRCQVDLVIDHSVQVDKFGGKQAYQQNVEIEMQRNRERYMLLKWAQNAFENFRVVPPGMGICHQNNLEYLAKVIWTSQDKQTGQTFAYPDTVVGTDSHTTMINGLGILGWGVGGIEAEAVMLGQPVSMIIPDVVGFELKGKLREGVTATDLVLTVTQLLRQKGVVGKFVEFYGEGLAHLPLAERATIANMAPEYGATCGLFPIDKEVIKYLEQTGREPSVVERVEAYAKAQGLWYDPETPCNVKFTDTLTLNLTEVEPSLAGPKHPQARVALPELKQAFDHVFNASNNKKTEATSSTNELDHGDIVIAAITSCTNTSNPSVMIAAGLLAKKAVEKGLVTKPWVKASLAPGSKVVTDYLEKAGLLPFLEKLGFYLVGYGCTTCIGNSGPLLPPVREKVVKNQLSVCSVLSGNRNFEGRIHPLVKANWLASPPLVVAFALAGTVRTDLATDPLGFGGDGKPVYLKDIWPSMREVNEFMPLIGATMFREQYKTLFDGDKTWQSFDVPQGKTYAWKDDSTYIRLPSFFEGMSVKPDAIPPIEEARILAVLGDQVTTDHISPAGAISEQSPAADYLRSHGVAPADFNTYGARRGNHEVMVRGTFANIRICNELLPNTEGGVTRYAGESDVMSIYEAAQRYQKAGVPLVVIAGKDYGMGSSRDWAAKGTLLLGVRAVIAESFERIHRSNLIGMGVLPLQFTKGLTRLDLKLTGDETISIMGLDTIAPHKTVTAVIKHPKEAERKIELLSCIHTVDEADYYRHGGILRYVLRSLMSREDS